MDKKEELFRMVSTCREQKEEDFSCQYKGNGKERFCRATSHKSCAGCTYYRIGIWDFFDRCYDQMTAKNKEVAQLRMENEDMKKDLERLRRR